MLFLEAQQINYKVKIVLNFYLEEWNQNLAVEFQEH